MKFLELTGADDNTPILINVDRIVTLTARNGDRPGSVVGTSEFGLKFVTESYAEVKNMLSKASRRRDGGVAVGQDLGVRIIPRLRDEH